MDQSREEQSWEVSSIAFSNRFSECFRLFGNLELLSLGEAPFSVLTVLTKVRGSDIRVFTVFPSVPGSDIRVFTMFQGSENLEVRSVRSVRSGSEGVFAGKDLYRYKE